MTAQVLLDPPVLFFALGLLSVFLKSDLKIPMPITKFLSLYLLMSIGFKGGVYLSKSGLNEEFILTLTGGLFVSAITPVALFHLLKKRLGESDAAAMGATYGSVSAVTFVAATTWLESRGLQFSGALIAILAMMEVPAIIIGLILAQRDPEKKAKGASVSKIIHEAFFNGSVFLLLGSLAIGWISGPKGAESLGAFTFDIFKGLLGFFLLDLGIKSGQALKRSEIPKWLIPLGIIVPLVNACIAISYSNLVGLSVPSTFLLTSLCAGASYIAVPAALKLALPEAKPGLYLTMALGVTFPFNILIGLPLYWEMISRM